KQETRNDLIAALAFTIGFIALELAQSGLSTENFLVPIASVAAGRASPRELGRRSWGTPVPKLGRGLAVVGRGRGGFDSLRPRAGAPSAASSGASSASPGCGSCRSARTSWPRPVASGGSRSGSRLRPSDGGPPGDLGAAPSGSLVVEGGPRVARAGLARPEHRE